MTMCPKTATTLPLCVLQKGADRLRAFRRDDSGVMTYPTIAFFLAMLAVGGIGVDLMRMERDRTVLQYTLDRAVLAAADLDQTQTPAVVVQDYLNKAGLGEYYSPPVVESGLGYKRVQATIDTTFEAHLLRFSRGGNMPLYASSKAEESIDGLEISLVLDVSGSMNSNRRLSNLKVAAKDFIDTMVANTSDGKMSISVVPYATQVSLPDDLIGQYSTTGTNPYSNCIDFSASDYTSADLPTDEELTRAMHFTPWGYRGRDMRTYYSSPRLITSPVCDERASREILPLQKDANTLKTFIQNLVAGGNTSIDTGMKWGTALLDPSARPAISAISTGVGASVPAEFSNRPVNYDDSDTIKIIVLMTDGQNTSQYYVDDDHRDGPSGAHFAILEGRNDTRRGTGTASLKVYSTYDAQNDRYYWHLPWRPQWSDHPIGTGTDSFYDCDSNGRNCRSIDEQVAAAHPDSYVEDPINGQFLGLNYSELFARTSLKYLYRYIFAEWMGNNSARNAWYYGVYSSHNNSTKNARTRSVCDAAKAKGIIVYTIGFEAPSNGVAVLRGCASTDAHYFDVNGLEIKDAFASIATSIRQLRLTQ
jgi:Flp pilus assembly protein TadG